MITETRRCHICGTVVQAKEFCPVCMANFEHRRPADQMISEEREIEMRRLGGPLEIPFGLIHQRIEELVGRPVFTHEMGLNWEGLLAEASHREHPTLQEVIELVPEEKRLIVNPEDPDHIVILMDALLEKTERHKPYGDLVTFAELQLRKRVRPEVLVAALDNYAYNGAAISAYVVCALINRVRRRISRPQLRRLAQAATHGVKDQNVRGHQPDAAKYQQVLELVQRKLSR